MGASLIIRPAATICSYGPAVPWPWGLIDLTARAQKPARGSVRTTIRLAHCDAHLVRAAGVTRAAVTQRIVLYIHGGAFLTCGVHTHGKLATMLSRRAHAPVLLVGYRKIPKHTVGMAVDDCYDAYQWLRRRGYRPEQIVLGGDSAGGYLALALAQRLQRDGEVPAALVAMSPLFELASAAKLEHTNTRTDAMLPPRALSFMADFVTKAAARRPVDGKPEAVYEPLDHIEPGLPRTLIHVSGAEILLHDAQLAGRRLAAAGVPVEIHVWPGQVHVFQLFAPAISEGVQSIRQIGSFIRDATQ